MGKLLLSGNRVNRFGKLYYQLKQKASLNYYTLKLPKHRYWMLGQ